MKKIIKKIWFYFLLFVMALSSLAFTGCQEEQEEIKDFYIVVTDNIGNTYSFKEEQEIYVQYEMQNTTLLFKQQAYYYDDTKAKGLYADGTFGVLDIRELGTYELDSYYTHPQTRKFVYFRMVVKVIQGPDNRPTPDVVLEAGEDCLEYTLNERYVYKYDGKEHFPKLNVSYQGNEIPVELIYYYLEDVKKFKGDMFVSLEEYSNKIPYKVVYPIGIYQFTLNLESWDSGLFGGKFSTYKNVELTFIVEIIE